MSLKPFSQINRNLNRYWLTENTKQLLIKYFMFPFTLCAADHMGHQERRRKEGLQ